VAGDPVERPLPKVLQNKKRIRREFLDAEWLSQQEDEITQLRIFQADEEVLSSDGGGAGEEGVNGEMLPAD